MNYTFLSWWRWFLFLVSGPGMNGGCIIHKCCSARIICYLKVRVQFEAREQQGNMGHILLLYAACFSSHTFRANNYNLVIFTRLHTAPMFTFYQEAYLNFHRACTIIFTHTSVHEISCPLLYNIAHPLIFIAASNASQMKVSYPLKCQNEHYQSAK
jgi:hypothetical protein